MTQILPPLTQEQQIVHDGIIAFMLDQDKVMDNLLEGLKVRVINKNEALLVGYAGVGKTTVTSHIVNTLNEKGKFGIAMTAPTNKAVQVLREKSNLSNVEFSTIHSLFGLEEDSTKEVITYRANKYKSRIDQIRFLLIDEVSQLHSEMYRHIEDGISDYPHLKIVYIGDDFQIPPVKDYGRLLSIPLGEWDKRGMLRYELNTIHRQAADNPIIQYATSIRKSKKMEWKNRCEVNRESLEPHLINFFLDDAFKRDSNFAKCVAYRNNTVNYLNKWIRGLLFGDGLPRIVPEDKLIATEGITQDDNIIIKNSQEMVALAVKPGTTRLKVLDRDYTFKILFTKVVVKDIVGEVVRDIMILDPESVEMHTQLCDKLAQNAKWCKDFKEKKNKWKLFWYVKRYFAGVNYNYCVTAHKAQGSTYQHVISHEWDINVLDRAGERERIRYVAATRAAETLIVC